MNFVKTFDIPKYKAEIIPAFFHAKGYKSEKCLPDTYRFKRGSRWAQLYTSDIEKWPTTVVVTVRQVAGDRVRVSANYNVDSRGGIETTDNRRKIMSEVEALESSTKEQRVPDSRLVSR